MKSTFDYIIVGQGIAGTILTYYLQKQGADVLVIDKHNASSSSNISAGLIHPITGRRKVKTWMADMLIPFAEQCYNDMEGDLGKKVYHKQNIIELVDSTREYNDWLSRSTDSEVKDYFHSEDNSNLYKDIITAPRGITLKHCGWLNAKLLISTFRTKLLAQGIIKDEHFNFSDLQSSAAGTSYKDLTACQIIFCDGWLATQNPYWSWLPFIPAKGEIITIHSPDLKLNHTVVKNIFILPIGSDLYKVGSNYEWKELNEIPTQKIKDELLKKLEHLISVPYEVVNHEAAVRPAIQDRRPVMGFHPENKNIGIFNGLGTKGALLAPYFANNFTQYLMNESKLNSEVSVERFYNLLQLS